MNWLAVNELRERIMPGPVLGLGEQENTADGVPVPTHTFFQGRGPAIRIPTKL